MDNGVIPSLPGPDVNGAEGHNRGETVENQIKTSEATAKKRELSQSSSGTDEENSSSPKDQFWRYIPLHQAILRGDWETASEFFARDPGASTARLTRRFETPLHIAAGTGKAIYLLKKLVEFLPPDALELKDVEGFTPLAVAALVGNAEAVVILVQQHPASLYIPSTTFYFPVHYAVENGHRETISCLLKVTKDVDPSGVITAPFTDPSGVELLYGLIFSGFYAEALTLVRRHPELAKEKDPSGFSALDAIAVKASAHLSGNRPLNFWERKIYSYVRVDCAEEGHSRGDDVENQLAAAKKKFNWGRGFREINFFKSVPLIKRIQQQKLTHFQSLQILKCLCREIRTLEDSEAQESFYRVPVLAAVRFNLPEVIEVIVDSFPAAIWVLDSENRYIFQQAVLYRCDKVFNLLYQMSEFRNFITAATLRDSDKNTMLHLAGELKHDERLKLVPCAALQMQRELQWFKEVKKFTDPNRVDFTNKNGETAATVFTREHKKLVEDGEKWMKDTATSCAIVAALIATVVFAAAITVPGGNDGTTGLPVFSNEIAFIIFAVSDAISLFTSTTSLLMFLSILTARYAEDDFLYVLPKRLIIGLLTLFVSITSMMVAFSTILYLVFGHKKPWVLIPLVALTSLPITSFVSLQYPLLRDLISSTYGQGIFGKQSDRPFY